MNFLVSAPDFGANNIPTVAQAASPIPSPSKKLLLIGLASNRRYIHRCGACWIPIRGFNDLRAFRTHVHGNSSQAQVNKPLSSVRRRWLWIVGRARLARGDRGARIV